MKILPLQPLNLLVAFLEEKILSAFGQGVVRAGTTLVVGNAAFDIVVDCTGLTMVIMFLSLVYATKTKIPPEKVLGYAAFFFVFNLFRLAFTLAIGANYGQGALDLVHPLLWFVDSGVVFACWAKEYGLLYDEIRHWFLIGFDPDYL